jgi:hypothetical protein
MTIEEAKIKIDALHLIVQSQSEFIDRLLSSQSTKSQSMWDYVPKLGNHWDENGLLDNEDRKINTRPIPELKLPAKDNEECNRRNGIE